MGFLHIVGLAACLVAGVSAAIEKNPVTELNYKLCPYNLIFPCESTKNIYLQSGRYYPKNVIVTRVQFYKDDAIVALPRYKHGVPFSLGKFSLRSRDTKPYIQPFPCWSLQEEGNPNAIQSAIDIFLDPLDILWVLDSGIVNTLEQPVRRHSPKIVAINVKTGQVVKVIDLSPFINCDSRLQYLVVDYTNTGKPYVYASDAGTGAIIVYDVAASKGFRIVLPKAVTGICEEKDVLYIALIRKPKGNVLYFTYKSSPNLYAIKAEYLQKGQAAGAVVDVGPKPSELQIVLLGTDNGAALFFRYIGESDIYIWNTETQFKVENFLLVQKGDDCRLATQVAPGWKRLMWTIESDFNDYITDTVGCIGTSVVVHPLIKLSD